VGPEALVEDIRWNTTEFTGAIMQPFEAWLMLLFLETLESADENTAKTPNRLLNFCNHTQSDSSKLSRAHRSPPIRIGKTPDEGQRRVCFRFVVPGGMEGAAKVMNNLELVVHAVTFGTSRTICMHPRTITHEHMTDEERLEAGVDDGLIRLSVGLEDPADIISDLDKALAHL
jgi:methionine-gamma-lyase